MTRPRAQTSHLNLLWLLFLRCHDQKQQTHDLGSSARHGATHEEDDHEEECGRREVPKRRRQTLGTSTDIKTARTGQNQPKNPKPTSRAGFENFPPPAENQPPRFRGCRVTEFTLQSEMRYLRSHRPQRLQPCSSPPSQLPGSLISLLPTHPCHV